MPEQLILQAQLLQIFGNGSGGLTGTGNFVSSLLGSVFGGFRESGGPVTAGKAFVVGEKRPELFIPSQSGTILPFVPQPVSVNQDGNQGGGGNMRIEVALSEGLEGRILQKAGAQSVQITRATGPAIARQGADLARDDYSRSGWSRR